MTIDKNLYMYTEQALRDYLDDRKRSELLREYISAPMGGLGERVDKQSWLSEQEIIFERMMQSGELEYLSKKTTPLKEFLSGLNDSDYKFVELRYFRQHPWFKVAEEMHVSEQTCRCRWAPRLIRKAAYLIFGVIAKKFTDV